MNELLLPGLPVDYAMCTYAQATPQAPPSPGAKKQEEKLEEEKMSPVAVAFLQVL